jgi:hypothetical protein
MKKTNIELIKKMIEYLNNKEEQRKYIIGENSFTRNRKMPFEKMIVFMVNLIKKSLSIELLNFQKVMQKIVRSSKKEIEYMTKSAFSQARKKISGLFFKKWNEVLVKEYYTDNEERIKRWHGKRIAATDGTTLYLINKAEIVKEFGVQKNQAVEVPMALVTCIYDVMNGLF